MVAVPWLASATLAAGVANAALLWHLWPRRDEPGGTWFVALIGVQVLWCLSYGLGLLVFDPLPRLALELVTWVAITWIGVTYFAFALAYTGRGHLLRTRSFGVLVAITAAGTLVVVSNPWHGLLFSDVRLDPVFGAATVTYDRGAWLFVQYGILLILASLGFFVLLDTVVSYGPLYRAQAIALALTPLLPAAAFTLWAFELGPYPQLNLTPVMFIPHMVLDSYALFSEGMFEFNPATRRTAERSGIDELGAPVFVTDPTGRIANCNDAAEALFDVDKQGVLGEALDGLFDAPLDFTADSQEVTVRRNGDARTLQVSTHPLEDATDTLVGYTVDVRDVTEERRREQRLAVLNRVLRHNLRNDLTVVSMNADLLETGVDDPTLAGYAETISRQSAGLQSLGEKARDAATALEGTGDVAVVDVESFLTALVSDEDRVSVAVDGPLRLETTPARLELAVSNAVENALEHGGEDGAVEVTAEPAGADAVRIQVRDDGPGMPAHELAVLADGEETALEHGSGIGLWLVRWGVDAVGGEVTWEAPEAGGTVVSMSVPGRLDESGE
jgi:PAS domain S-box-containing protein